MMIDEEVLTSFYFKVSKELNEEPKILLRKTMNYMFPPFLYFGFPLFYPTNLVNYGMCHMWDLRH